MEFNKRNWIGVGIGVLVIISGLLFLWDTKLLYFTLVLGGVVVALPFLISFILKSGRQKDKEKVFLDFVQDLVENVKSGTPIGKGILNLKNRDYGVLNEHVKKLSNQLELGIPLTKALSIFAKDTKSKVISRAVSLISEAEKAGGKIDTILESVARSVNQIEELKKEQKTAVYNLVVQGYIIFIVFIIIMLVLQFKILPMTADLASIEDLTIKPSMVNPEEFSTPLFFLLVVQSIFAGLVIGKVSEGSFKDGIKHSFILLALTLLITTGANALLG